MWRTIDTFSSKLDESNPRNQFSDSFSQLPEKKQCAAQMDQILNWKKESVVLLKKGERPASVLVMIVNSSRYRGEKKKDGSRRPDCANSHVVLRYSGQPSLPSFRCTVADRVFYRLPPLEHSYECSVHLRKHAVDDISIYQREIAKGQVPLQAYSYTGMCTKKKLRERQKKSQMHQNVLTLFLVVVQEQLQASHNRVVHL